jgi:hypothetical protein
MRDTRLQVFVASRKDLASALSSQKGQIQRTLHGPSTFYAPFGHYALPSASLSAFSASALTS